MTMFLSLQHHMDTKFTSVPCQMVPQLKHLKYSILIPSYIQTISGSRVKQLNGIIFKVTNEHPFEFWLNTADLNVIMCGFGVPSYKGTGKRTSSSVSFVILMKLLMGDRGARRR